MSLATSDRSLSRCAPECGDLQWCESDRTTGADEPQRGRFSWRLGVLFVCVAGIALFYNLGDFRTLGTHEAFAAVPAREMMESGDWIIPRYGGVERFKKPPLAYWILASLGKVCGGLNETIVRVPSALSAVLLAVLMGVWAGRWYGRDVGWAAAFVQLTSYFVLVYGRKAEIDMTVWLLITAALFLIAHQPLKESRGRSFLRWAVIGGLIAISWLGKFHYGATMIVAPTVVCFLIQKRGMHLFRFLNPMGLLLIAAAVFVWPWLVVQRFPLSCGVWYYETVGRATGMINHLPVWYFLPIILASMLPWTPLVLMEVKRSWQRAWKQADANERFLWVWFVTHFAIVTVQPDKHPHYLAAALPVLTLLAAQRLPVILRQIQNGKWTGIVPATLTTLGIGAAVTVAAYFVVLEWPDLKTPVISVAAVIAVGVSATAWLAAARRPLIAGCLNIATALTAVVIVFGWIVPQYDQRLEIVRFVQQARKELGKRDRIHVLNMGQHSLLFYVEEPNRRVDSIDELRRITARRGRVFVIVGKFFRPEHCGFGEYRILRQMDSHARLPSPKDSPLVLMELHSAEKKVHANQHRSANNEPISTSRQRVKPMAHKTTASTIPQHRLPTRNPGSVTVELKSVSASSDVSAFGVEPGR